MGKWVCALSLTVAAPWASRLGRYNPPRIPCGIFLNRLSKDEIWMYRLLAEGQRGRADSCPMTYYQTNMNGCNGFLQIIASLFFTLFMNWHIAGGVFVFIVWLRGMTNDAMFFFGETHTNTFSLLFVNKTLLSGTAETNNLVRHAQTFVSVWLILSFFSTFRAGGIQTLSGFVHRGRKVSPWQPPRPKWVMECVALYIWFLRRRGSGRWTGTPLRAHSCDLTCLF